MVVVRYNPAPGLPAMGKVPLYGFVSPPPFGINSTHYPGMQKEHPAAQPLSPAVSWRQQRKVEAVHDGACQTKTFPPRPYVAPYRVHSQRRTLDWEKRTSWHHAVRT